MSYGMEYRFGQFVLAVSPPSNWQGSMRNREVLDSVEALLCSNKKHCSVITAIVVKNPKHGIIQAFTKKINSIQTKTITVPLSKSSRGELKRNTKMFVDWSLLEGFRNSRGFFFFSKNSLKFFCCSQYVINLFAFICSNVPHYLQNKLDVLYQLFVIIAGVVPVVQEIVNIYTVVQ